MENTPAPGQRWISTSEPELGLGLVLEADAACVRLLFPATGEIRKYALSSAPLQRVRFQVGDEVENQEGRSFRVERVDAEGPLLVYHGGGFALPEPELADRHLQQGPKERFLSGQADASADFERRCAVWQRQHKMARNPGLGLMGGRIEWIPHQIAIAHEVSRRVLPRVLLADEVGLGKTIEACLILHHALVTGRVQRALILVPEALVHQWFVELLRRFHLMFAIYDAERCAALAGENPFLDEQWILCGTDLLADSPELAKAAAEAGWDMLIVDEAHHLAWTPESPSPAYLAVEALAHGVPSVLLLTATPEQMGEESHFAHLRLLDPDRYPAFESFLAEQAEYTQIAEKAAALREAGETEALRELLDQHGPGRVMFRNTREQIAGFPTRIPHPVLLSDQPDAKTDWLAVFLQENPEEKILLMTRSPKQVRSLDIALRARMDVGTVLFHEEQTLLERDRQAAWFADPEGARLMIASDIGGEGRNFQFVRHLVLFDLPADPERIEQRIGRLDRIGQKSDIHIHLPVIEGQPEADLLRWLHEGLQVFSRPLQCGHRCLEIFRDRLDHVDDALIAETRETVECLESELRAGRHRLIQWKHELEESVDEEMAVLRASDDDPDLLPFAETLWSAFGLEFETLQADDHLLKAGSFYTGELPVRDEGLRFTPRRSRALEREDMDLLTWDHPLLRDGIEALLSSQGGTCACAHAEGLEGPLLQVLFILESMAPPALQVKRFLPPTPILLTLDSRGKPWREPVHITGEADAGALLVNPAFRNDWLPARIEDAERKANGASRHLRVRAAESAETLLSAELHRLRELRKINDHVREAEIDHLAAQMEAVREAIDQARPRLDALRLILP
ncbi:MAG: DEAD/DEAH box helicase family protein [Verrucomicrobia bacterium]|nr:DEAD/DEAH box helicase family protein [Verrucomicrobiota bacterium]MCH8511961.1 DEAD/DEAH box helicase family protein [Kiritimatiellia bacterium]